MKILGGDIPGLPSPLYEPLTNDLVFAPPLSPIPPLPPPPFPGSEPKNHGRENLRRIREIQSKAHERREGVIKPVKPVIRNEKYQHIQAKVTVHMQVRVCVVGGGGGGGRGVRVCVWWGSEDVCGGGVRVCVRRGGEPP